jgi:sulfur carrier protein ThiS
MPSRHGVRQDIEARRFLDVRFYGTPFKGISKEKWKDKSMDVQNLDGDEVVDIELYAKAGQAIPVANGYRVRIDEETVTVKTHCATGQELLAKVGKRPCAFELIEEFIHHGNNVVESGEEVSLMKPGLKGFITAHKEIVDITINEDPYPIERGERTVAEILSKVNQTPEAYILLEEKDGPPMPIPPNQPVRIRGCEVFHTQVQSGGSS